MKDEVEDFLRRVAQMRAEAQAKGQQARPPQPPKPPPTPPPAPPPRLVPPPTAATLRQPIEAEIVDAELAERADQVAREMSQHLRGPAEIAEHTRHLGEEVDQADDKLEARLHQVFDHQLGRLKKSEGDAAAAPVASAAAELSAVDISRLLHSPQSIRDAIIMAEVLRRPDYFS